MNFSPCARAINALIRHQKFRGPITHTILFPGLSVILHASLAREIAIEATSNHNALCRRIAANVYAICASIYTYLHECTMSAPVIARRDFYVYVVARGFFLFILFILLLRIAGMSVIPAFTANDAAERRQRPTDINIGF